MKHRIAWTACCILFPLGLTAQSAKAPKSDSSASLEQKVRALEDRQQILATMYKYAYEIDFGKDTHEYTNLYTEDAVFQNVPSPPPPDVAAEGGLFTPENSRPTNGAVVGRQALEQWITNEWQNRDRNRAAGRYVIHEMAEPDITLSGDRALVRSYFQTTNNDNGRIYIGSIGVYQDVFVRSPDGRWRIKERLLVRQGGNGGGAAGRGGAAPK